MNEQVLQSCADYHGARSRIHASLALASDGESRKHHQERAALHKSWQAEIEAAMAEQKLD